MRDTSYHQQLETYIFLIDAVALYADRFHLVPFCLPIGLGWKGFEILRSDCEESLEFPGEPFRYAMVVRAGPDPDMWQEKA